MKKTLIPEGTPLFENIDRNQIPEILESLSAVRKDYHKNEGILRQGDSALILHDRNDCLIKPTIRGKVLTYLSLEAEKTGSRSFSIPLNRAAMTEYLNVDRSALSRELSRMKQDGLIEFSRSHFRLLT